MPDREKVIKAIETHLSIDDSVGCDDCTYENDGWCTTRVLSDALSLLKEQPEIVRCKDCKKRDSWECWQYFFGRIKIPDNWFCADAKRREVK